MEVAVFARLWTISMFADPGIVSIATVAEDVGTTVTGIQTAITLYTLGMAMLMIPGGKIGSQLTARGDRAR